MLSLYLVQIFLKSIHFDRLFSWNVKSVFSFILITKGTAAELVSKNTWQNSSKRFSCSAGEGKQILKDG